MGSYINTVYAYKFYSIRQLEIVAVTSPGPPSTLKIHVFQLPKNIPCQVLSSSQAERHLKYRQMITYHNTSYFVLQMVCRIVTVQMVLAQMVCRIVTVQMVLAQMVFRIVTVQMVLAQMVCRIVTVQMVLAQMVFRIVTVQMVLAQMVFRIVTVQMVLAQMVFRIVTVQMVLAQMVFHCSWRNFCGTELIYVNSDARFLNVAQLVVPIVHIYYSK